jgi:phosphatidylglycerol---prolipoprotein diacylglyceryl transferase
VPFPEFDPVVHIGSFPLQWGPLAVRWYALAYVAGILLGWRYAVRIVRNPALWVQRRPPLTTDQIDDLVLWVTLGVIVGGRLGHVLFYTPAVIWQDPLQILQIWEGGMSFHGGAIGVFVAFALYAWRNRLDVWRVGDVVAPVVPIGLFFGRIANFVNGELWGRETTVPWAVRFCNEKILAAYNGICPAGDAPRHPSQLYEAALEGVALFAILWWAVYRAKLLNRRGVVMGLFAAGYALFRLSLENVRQPDAGLDQLPFGLTMGMILSIPMLVFGLWVIWRGIREPLPSGVDPAADPQRKTAAA